MFCSMLAFSKADSASCGWMKMGGPAEVLQSLDLLPAHAAEKLITLRYSINIPESNRLQYTQPKHM